MTKYKIVADSSSDIHTLDKIPFESVPLKIITDLNEYVDDDSLDVANMIEQLRHYKGKSSTSCPNSNDYLNAFGDADAVFCITISSALSGSYNAAVTAKNIYLEKHPERKVCVINSLSTGGEMRLIIDKLTTLINQNFDFDIICNKIAEYQKTTGLIFMLESMRNLANNGRISHFTAKAAGLLGIRALGVASDEGTLKMLDKLRGEQNALLGIISRLKNLGYCGGKLEISHCQSAEFAQKIKAAIKTEFEKAEVNVINCGGLCSFYAESKGIIIGFEKNKNILN